MKRFTIHLPLDSYALEDGSSNNFGEIYLQVGDIYFPSQGWTDFGKTVFFSWLEEITKLFLKQNTKIRCKFMDGNYRFDMEATSSPGIIITSLIKEKGGNEKLENQEELNSEQLFEEFHKVILLMQEEFRNRNNYEAVKRVETDKKAFLKAWEEFNDKS